MKTLIPLLQPLGVIWVLLGSWLLWRLWRHRWQDLWLPGLAWVIFSVMTCTPLASLLMARLEGVPKMPDKEWPVVDAIVCLGGGAEPSFVEPTGFHLNPSADRLSTALMLHAQKKAPVLVLGGGGYKESGVMHSEADRVLKGLELMGLETSGMVSLGVCANTRDEALKVSALMKERGWTKILLVTSAFHMPRAEGTFVKAGVSLGGTVRCNYVSSVNHVGDFRWLHLPHANGFNVYKYWFHEVIGTWVYQWRGWM
ncbi:YdcF family protein [Phragmitibacter flavus]|uniref:YdcF family protein n=1 Tax=Phragmitibacter flavus TaxID=2576071 RepID=A0A5R8KJC4_9BACT|nr:YdcF family protein [Phragmitibacter flavus]TLD72414.1 YdcF family protein [Phragmitibacter flavus]